MLTKEMSSADTLGEVKKKRRRISGYETTNQRREYAAISASLFTTSNLALFLILPIYWIIYLLANHYVFGFHHNFITVTTAAT